jgi:hypothetical protein
MQFKKSLTWSTSSTHKELVSIVIPEEGDAAAVQLKVWPFTLTVEEGREMVTALNCALDWFRANTRPTADAPQPV